MILIVARTFLYQNNEKWISSKRLFEDFFSRISRKFLTYQFTHMSTLSSVRIIALTFFVHALLFYFQRDHNLCWFNYCKSIDCLFSTKKYIQNASIKLPYIFFFDERMYQIVLLVLIVMRKLYIYKTPWGHHYVNSSVFFYFTLFSHTAIETPQSKISSSINFALVRGSLGTKTRLGNVWEIKLLLKILDTSKNWRFLTFFKREMNIIKDLK